MSRQVASVLSRSSSAPEAASDIVVWYTDSTLREAVKGVESLFSPHVPLVHQLPLEGLEVSLDIEQAVGFGTMVDQLLFRACQESLRNVEKHAKATHVSVRVHRERSSAVLEVADDGRGIGEHGGTPAEGHVGLQLVRDLVGDAGGTLTVAPAPGGGTVVRVEVPTT